MDKSAPVEGLYVGIVAANRNCQIFLLPFQMTFKFGINIWKLKLDLTHDIWDYHSSKHKFYSLLKSDAMFSGRKLLIFWRDTLPRLLRNTKYGCMTFCWNVSKFLTDYTATQPRRECSVQYVYDTQLLPIVRMTSGMHVSMESKAMGVSQECRDK